MQKVSDELRALAKQLNALRWRDMMDISEAIKDGAVDLQRGNNLDAAGMALVLQSLAEEIIEHDEAKDD